MKRGTKHLRRYGTLLMFILYQIIAIRFWFNSNGAHIDVRIVKPGHSSDNTTNLHLPLKKFVPWKQRTDKPVPCLIEPTGSFIFHRHHGKNIQGQPSKVGLLYIKNEKAASSTLASVAVRIAHAIAQRTNATETNKDGNVIDLKLCSYRGISHLWSTRTGEFKTRDHDQSFLWTFLKDPTRRQLSLFFYFYVDWDDTHEYTTETFFQFMNKMDGKPIDGQANKLNGRTIRKQLKGTQNETIINEYIQQMINEMDFIGLVERMDESLVLLALMLDLPMSDVLSINSKLSGNYMIQHRSQKCRRMGYSRPLLPGIQDYLQSAEWMNMTKIDNMLYAAVNRSIDHTIEHVIGQHTFNKAMQEFLDAKMLIVKDHCSNSIVTVCTSNGTKVPARSKAKCYHGDVGCGYECLNSLFPFK